jgi:Cys/Met metabolism PLP-dependent enzyme
MSTYQSALCGVVSYGVPGVRADIICSSLTKIFSGRGDVLAGSIIINSHSFPTTSSSSPDMEVEVDGRAAARAQQLNSIVRSLSLPPLYLADAVTLEKNSRDFESRCRIASSNGKALAEWLSGHPCVGDLYYSSGEEYESVMRIQAETETETEKHALEPGYGSLMSIVLSEGMDEKAFFDALELSKGPSLGTNFTLACPYTLLAHYTELDWASKYGVDKRLIRVSVGLEDIEVGHTIPYRTVPFHIMLSCVVLVLLCNATLQFNATHLNLCYEVEKEKRGRPGRYRYALYLETRAGCALIAPSLLSFPLPLLLTFSLTASVAPYTSFYIPLTGPSRSHS